MVGIEDTNVVAEGKNGLVPHVGENGNWFIGEEDTRVKAQGKDGKPGPSGKPPYIGETGIEVGMYGKSNYEEVISYDDLKSKLGL